MTDQTHSPRKTNSGINPDEELATAIARAVGTLYLIRHEIRTAASQSKDAKRFDRKCTKLIFRYSNLVIHEVHEMDGVKFAQKLSMLTARFMKLCIAHKNLQLTGYART